MKTDASERLGYNKKVHDLLAPLYEERHGEIFNDTEQRRIRHLLHSLLGSGDGRNLRALDFGSGTGNLTRHLLKLRLRVLAADVSEGCLGELRARSGALSHLETMVLNGQDLAGVASGSMDLVATYSVLHHVPDYLAIIDEFVRVTKPGGLIYLDHEVAPCYWEDDPLYASYLQELELFQASRRASVPRRLLTLLRRKGWWRYLLAAVRLKAAPIADDGDIHVHREDHIEWAEIRKRLEPRCDIVAEEDYLVCREREIPPAIWSRWNGRCVDMRYMVARKR